MSKYSLQYRAARRRVLSSRPLTFKPVVNFNNATVNKIPSVRTWQQASFVGFNPEAGQYRIRSFSGEISQATRIPGYGAEFGGVGTGASGLLSQGFWSN